MVPCVVRLSILYWRWPLFLGGFAAWYLVCRAEAAHYPCLYLPWRAVGPQGVNVVINDSYIEVGSTMGIILLMFLLCLHLRPPNLLKQLKQTALVTFLCLSAIEVMIWALLVFLFRFPTMVEAVAGQALAFSSTLLSLKLILTTTLHHQQTGRRMSILFIKLGQYFI